MLPRVFCAAVLVAAVLVATSSQAVNFSPVKFELQPDQKATQLTISNTDDVTRTFDIRVHKWTGVDQVTALSVTTALEDSPILLSRPVVTLKPRSSATIRIAVAARTPGVPADYYRLFIDDITPADEMSPPTGSSAAIRISVSLPLEVRNSKNIVGKLTVLPDGKLTNSGNNIVSVLGLNAKKPDGTMDSSMSRYIFPSESWVTNHRPEDLTWLAGLQ